MALHVALTHRTTYTYDRPVSLGPQIVRLRPAPHSRTGILSYSMTIEPEPFVNWQQDPFSNYLARLVFPEQTTRFQVVVDLIADIRIINPFDFFLAPDAEQFPFAYAPDLREDLSLFLRAEHPGPLLRALLNDIPLDAPRASVDFLVDLNQNLERRIDYIIRMEPGVQSCEETLELGRGSCRDSAWLLVQILRNLGLAARFVSGYLIQLTPDVKSLDGPSGTAADFTDLHAWAEVYLPGAGWVGLDPTSGLFAGEGHIPLACTPEPRSAAPITGMVDECAVEFDFEMSVTRIVETPRVTKPYTDAQWQTILQRGAQVDAVLEANDVRLTMGGEPTFVSQEHGNHPEWSTAALGPTKRPRAADLMQRLADRFAPGALLHHGQGKWYPGEPLPRWALSIYWREDGQPLWRDASLLANDDDTSAADTDMARRFIGALSVQLGLSEDFIQPAYEDPWHFIHREGQLPPGMDPLNADLGDPLERRRLRRVFLRGLGRPVGFALPVQRWNTADQGHRWMSEVWRPRAGRLFLLPGDSSMGYRLPLTALHAPLRSPDLAPIIPQDPFAAVAPLPDPTDRPRPQTPLQPDALLGEVSIRTALCVEAREGRLHVFLPPMASGADFVELVSAIEDTAAAEEVAVRLEGYTPPHHAGIREIKVTPDPGVIEVNVHPARDWTELVSITTGLYEDAYHARLSTEKFMLDGRHTGTGGGNHIVVGGATPADSPFLRRPALLGSLINFWQHHPSLSYLFSGLFIGPTSQAPRTDEARQDLLYEMELALSQLPDPTEDVPPWLVDRMLRDMLVDVTGNTHRSEICIDKLFSPDGAAGRLGLVEFRSFEMPPHAQMSLVQQLLMRAIIARFWKQPYRRPLIRWGTQLHDRFMLPHYIWDDFVNVLAELRDHGFDLDPQWFAPHFAFRFPMLGERQHGEVHIALRQALEPWYVLGEEGNQGATARYVDSSLERVQVKVRGLNGDRYVLTCNGVTVPLRSTGVAGEQVAGVRFRAWQPPRAFHPTVRVNVPLVFDLVDTGSGRSVAGCTYHVAHPGGRNYETFPINAYEAEGRRHNRFSTMGHTPGPMTPRPAPRHPEYPLTLDLRFTR